MLLAVDNLSITVGGHLVVDGISLSLGAGECLALVGESGSGKTMIAHALLGLSPGTVTADSLMIGSRDARQLSSAEWRSLRGTEIALISQDALVALDPLRRVGREVAEVVEVHESLRRAEVGARVIRALEDAAMPDAAARAEQYPHELSGGLRQRALIASAVAGRPRVLIADEPTTALDATVQAQILLLLGQLKRDGLGLLLITHDLAAVAGIADRVAVMQRGRIVESGPTATILRKPTHEYTRKLLSAVPRPRNSFVAGAPGMSAGDGGADAPPTGQQNGAIVLEAVRLRKSYGARVAVDDVSFSVRAGETLGIVGESGSGKSTIARLLLGLEAPDAGEVILDAEPWSSLRESQRRGRRHRIQLIDQDPFGSFDPRWSVQRLLREAIELGEKPTTGRVSELLAQVGLSDEHLARRRHELSGGQRQRVAIARALARRPGILVCDEPVSALDLQIQAQVLTLLESLQRDLGLSMVFISHDLAVIRQMSDEIVVMREGVVLERGAAACVLGEPQHPFTRQLVESSNINLF
ncbi:MAG: dipeptide ABC transporter ATP-binding protein [Microbacteriaceae bacterium]